MSERHKSILIVAVATMLVVLVIRAGHADTVCPEGEGVWTTRAGIDECRPCLAIARYADKTPLPFGCPAMLPGVLWTVDADVANAGELAALRTERDELEAEAGARTRELLRDRLTCAKDLRAAAGDLRDCSRAVTAIAPSPWPERLAGAAVGLVVGGAAVWAIMAAGG